MIIRSSHLASPVDDLDDDCGDITTHFRKVGMSAQGAFLMGVVATFGPLVSALGLATHARQLTNCTVYHDNQCVGSQIDTNESIAARR